MLRKKKLIGHCRDIRAHMDILVHRDFSRGIAVGAWKDSRTGDQEDKRAWDDATEMDVEIDCGNGNASSYTTSLPPRDKLASIEQLPRVGVHR